MKKFIIGLFLACASFMATAQTCTTTLNPGAQVNIGATVAAAAPGSTICLNDGTYNWTQGTDGDNEQQFESINKSPRVTIRSVNGKNAILPAVQVTASRGLVFKNLTIQGGEINDYGVTPQTRGITFIDNDIRQFNINIRDGSNFDVLFYKNTFGGYDSDGVEGTVMIVENGGDHTGNTNIKFEHNIFEGGSCADGIQVAVADPSIIIGPGNIFRNWLTPCNDVHSDAIQIVGTQDSLTIVGNYFENNSVHIGFYDGGLNCIIANNVFVGGGMTRGPDAVVHQAFQIGGIIGMSFAHNTLVNIPDSGIGTKTEFPPNNNWIIENNILINSVLQSGGNQPGCGTSCIVRDNQRDSSSSLISGTTNINNTVATASLKGPLTSPSTTADTWAGYSLNINSPGKGTANDGKDKGSTYFNPTAVTNFQVN